MAIATKQHRRNIMDTLTIDVRGLSDTKVRELEQLIEQWKQQEQTTDVPNFTATEQKALARAKKKIAAIQRDLANSKGLTREEVDVAAKAGLIDPDQRYWWTEEWQEGEREAERDIEAGRTSVPFEKAEDILAHLHKQRV
jgi:hypothetical protein